jgi:hypothetical protein
MLFYLFTVLTRLTGEQSVGKSFALNHFVDTSFAGSAMRTTEGVWMSVTPTKGALIVALDFEGVHSIERSAQEDTLLVLFNTAISNLVCVLLCLILHDFSNLFRCCSGTTSHSLVTSPVCFNPSSPHRRCWTRLAIHHCSTPCSLLSSRSDDHYILGTIADLRTGCGGLRQERDHKRVRTFMFIHVDNIDVELL